MKRCGQISAMILLMLAGGCGGKESECKTVLGSLRSLGKKLAAAQSVTSRENAAAQHVSIALRSFARDATSTGEALAAARFTVPSLGEVAADASDAALSLAESAMKMVTVAEQMRGLDPARHAVSIQRTLAEVAAAKIQQMCATNTAECAALSQVMRRRPAFPNTSIDPTAAAAWTEQTTHWVDSLTALELGGPELQNQVANLAQTSKSFAAALADLAKGNDSAKELTLATQAFSDQVAAVGTALTAAQAICKP